MSLSEEQRMALRRVPPEGNEAYCFTSGMSGAILGAGTIHACLAADRKRPAVLAGISAGAITAAAMQRSYSELENAPPTAKEAARWAWFRSYVTALTRDPLETLWNGIPDQSDFFSDLPPVKSPEPETFDESVACYESREDPDLRQTAAEFFSDQERAARRELYLLVKLGSWLSHFKGKLSLVANVLVSHVRASEKYPSPQWRRSVAKWGWRIWLILIAVFHVVFHPQWFPEFKFASGNNEKSQGLRPLFGWRIYLLCVIGLTCPILFVFFCGELIRYLCVYLLVPRHPSARLLIAFLSSLAIGVIGLYLILRVKDEKRSWRQDALENLELRRALIHEYHLLVTLVRLFGKNGISPTVGGISRIPLLIVAAPLQTRSKEKPTDEIGSNQVWPDDSVLLIEALRGALAVPGIFAPLRVTKLNLSRWSRLDPTLDYADIVDGSVIRDNPVPALFQYLDQHEELAERLSVTDNSVDAKVHVIYGVPLGPQAPGTPATLEPPNIVDNGLLSLTLAKRRDTKFELLQMNFISRLQLEIESTRHAHSGKYFSRDFARPILADEIAPSREVSFDNPLKPGADKMLAEIAHGCQRTLGHLYRNEIQRKDPYGFGIKCSALLQEIAPAREGHGCGLSEVCGNCSGLVRLDEHASSELENVFSVEEEPSPSTRFTQLTGNEPRIVVVMSGGVFRGTFHAGMIAAMVVADIRPDLIVGASVGTIMGGALAAAVTSHPSQRRHILVEIVETMLNVDERIAFTAVLKGAARDLGVRARDINLSPNAVRKMVARGSRADAGFAAVGAPPALIDAISKLFIIPHNKTATVAADFVAGHVSRATRDFLLQLKLETLHQLRIEHALIGATLLEATVGSILGKHTSLDLRRVQPFMEQQLAFFATATDIRSRASILLGARDRQSYDFVQAALASSAFPVVFTPKAESDVFPGVGSASIFFSDGGMFDNLPFIPALRILSEVQVDYAARQRSADGHFDSVSYLKNRAATPDLFLAGSLDVSPSEDEVEFDDLTEIVSRSGALQKNVKIRNFQEASSIVGKQTRRLLRLYDSGAALQNARFVDEIVVPAVLPIYPSDHEHLNGTFHFCASLGLDRKRVARSIADGCYQTLSGLAAAQALRSGSSFTDRSVLALTRAKRIAPLRVLSAAEPIEMVRNDGRCPYFQAKGQTITCPFWNKTSDSGSLIFDTCIADKVHR